MSESNANKEFYEYKPQDPKLIEGVESLLDKAFLSESVLKAEQGKQSAVTKEIYELYSNQEQELVLDRHIKAAQNSSFELCDALDNNQGKLDGALNGFDIPSLTGWRFEAAYAEGLFPGLLHSISINFHNKYEKTETKRVNLYIDPLTTTLSGIMFQQDSSVGAFWDIEKLIYISNRERDEASEANAQNVLSHGLMLISYVLDSIKRKDMDAYKLECGMTQEEIDEDNRRRKGNIQPPKRFGPKELKRSRSSEKQKQE